MPTIHSRAPSALVTKKISMVLGPRRLRSPTAFSRHSRQMFFFFYIFSIDCTDSNISSGFEPSLAFSGCGSRHPATQLFSASASQSADERGLDAGSIGGIIAGVVAALGAAAAALVVYLKKKHGVENENATPAT
jgi:hypothetical protein